jgi:hypothetical protein
MAEKEGDPVLSEATLDDIVRELGSRRLSFALYVNHMTGGGYLPGGDVPSGERQMVYADPSNAHPAWKVYLLCQAMQLCLIEPEVEGHHPLTLELSKAVHAIQERLGELNPDMEA